MTRARTHADPLDHAALEPSLTSGTADHEEERAPLGAPLASENGAVSDPESSRDAPSDPPIFDRVLAKMQAQRAAERKAAVTAIAADAGRQALERHTHTSVHVPSVVSPPPDTQGDPSDPLGIIARVMARQQEREPVLAAIAADATRRALEVQTWDATRHWSLTRLREAWVVARYGAHAAAQSGPATAGTVTDEQHARLKRAAARYERYAAARPDGYPPLALAAILHIAAQAHQKQIEPVGAPRTLRYAIGALDQLSKRMRAIATADKPERYEKAAARAQRRHQKTRAAKLQFRSEWPRWILLPGQQEPTFGPDGTLQLDPDAATWAPPPSSGAYLLAIRDAHLLNQRPLPAQADGRRVMAHRHQHPDTRTERQEARALGDLELRELAHRTHEPLDNLAELSPTLTSQWLNKLRQQEAEQARADHDAYRDALVRSIKSLG